MALWRTGEEAMAGLANPQADVTRFEMAGRFTVAAALQKVAPTGYLFVYLKARQNGDSFLLLRSSSLYIMQILSMLLNSLPSLRNSSAETSERSSDLICFILERAESSK